MAERAADTSHGPGRLLVAAYAILAIGATGRSGVQLATGASEAPLAYGLSAFAAVVYIVATLALARDWWRLALVACSVELVGVLSVGTLTVVDAGDFPDATVWSLYGQGYLFLPLVLPVLGLLWLRRTGRSRGPVSPRA
ncbi:hypothetical protein KLP28_10150 [Nocardioidaceae bacterium]|nr:hypothetical protein KLP28_10150 [Nocardioidaceae bacterium]